MASRAIMKEMKDFVALVKTCDITLRRMILFGSYAQNRESKYSDIDVVLVADEFIGVAPEDVYLFMPAMREHYMVHPKTYNTKDFSPDVDPFVEEILKTGIELYPHYKTKPLTS